MLEMIHDPNTDPQRNSPIPREDFARQLSFANLSMDELIQAVEEDGC